MKKECNVSTVTFNWLCVNLTYGLWDTSILTSLSGLCNPLSNLLMETGCRSTSQQISLPFMALEISVPGSQDSVFWWPCDCQIIATVETKGPFLYALVIDCTMRWFQSWATAKFTSCCRNVIYFCEDMSKYLNPIQQLKLFLLLVYLV